MSWLGLNGMITPKGTGLAIPKPVPADLPIIPPPFAKSTPSHPITSLTHSFHQPKARRRFAEDFPAPSHNEYMRSQSSSIAGQGTGVPLPPLFYLQFPTESLQKITRRRAAGFSTHAAGPSASTIPVLRSSAKGVSLSVSMFQPRPHSTSPSMPVTVTPSSESFSERHASPCAPHARIA